MRAIVHIALSEFGKAFRRRVGTPAARDFLWLTIFFVLSGFIAFVGWSARAGIWDRFEQVLLGALPEDGPPIRLTRHYNFLQSIQPLTIDKFKRDFPDLQFVPMLSMDGATSSIIFPGVILQPRDPVEAGKEVSPKQRESEEASWLEQGKNAGAAQFLAQAVPTDSPLWRWIRQRSGAAGTSIAGQAPLVVAANRSQFRKHFHLENYRKALLRDPEVSCVVRNEVARMQGPEPDTLVLGIKEGAEGYGYQSFKVLWFDSFPLADPVALILPLSTTELATAAWRRDVTFYLEGGGEPVTRVRELRLADIDYDASGVGDFRKIAACLGAMPAEAAKSALEAKDRKEERAKWQVNVCGVGVEPAERVQDMVVPMLTSGSIDLKIETPARYPLASRDVARCAQGTRFASALALNASGGLPPNLRRTYAEPSVRANWVDFSRVQVPCNRVLPEDNFNARKAGETPEAGCERPPPEAADQSDNTRRAANPEDGEKFGVAYLRGYSDAMVYVRGRAAQTRKSASIGEGLSTTALAAEGSATGPPVSTSGLSLDAIVELLLGWTQFVDTEDKTVFQLDAAYEGALVRFGVLSTIIDKMALPMAAGMVVFYLVLSGVILATTFLHRRAQYGLLFMNGAEPWKLEILVLIQIGTACLIGCALGYIGFAVVAQFLNSWLAGSDIIRKAAMVIGLDVKTFLSNLTLLNVLSIWGLMTFAGFVIGAVILRIQGISTAQAPIDLIKS